MVSDVTAEIAARRDAVDVIEALFPCGSITGAPKIRASEVIAEIEASPRGAYTGAIGRIDAEGDAIFNVAIRTPENGRAHVCTPVTHAQLLSRILPEKKHIKI